MGFFSKLVGGGVSDVVKGVGDVVNNFIETPDEQRDFEKFKIQVQTEINKVEASNNNFFVSGARPAILWVCAFAFFYHFVLQPLLIFFINVGMIAFGLDPTVFNQIIAFMPEFDMESLLYVMGGILGLGGLRTYEKKAGVARN